MGGAWVEQIGKSFSEALGSYVNLEHLNSMTMSELKSPKHVEPVPLFAEQLFASGRFAVASANLAESFSPMGPNSGGGRGLA